LRKFPGKRGCKGGGRDVSKGNKMLRALVKKLDDTSYGQGDCGGRDVGKVRPAVIATRGKTTTAKTKGCSGYESGSAETECLRIVKESNVFGDGDGG